MSAESQLAAEDLALNLELSHDRICDLRKLICAADVRVIAARALRRARAAEIVAAWQAGALSEQQAAQLLGWRTDPIMVRELLERIVRDCNSRWANRQPVVRHTHGD